MGIRDKIKEKVGDKAESKLKTSFDRARNKALENDNAYMGLVNFMEDLNKRRRKARKFTRVINA